MSEHNPDTCAGLTEVRLICSELVTHKKQQNGTLLRLEAKVDALSIKVEMAALAEAQRKGAEGMLKWILTFTGASTIISLASLLWKAAGP